VESYLLDWLAMILRWLHLITGIAWIGASFYFIWLDNSLEEPPQWKKDRGIRGELWAVHGGGIYEVGKYRGAPEAMPTRLHWFKWEAYSTWITGMALLVVLYYLGARGYLIDPRVADLNVAQAVSLGAVTIAVSWFVYNGLCRSPLARRGWLLGAVLLVTGGVLAWALTQTFSGRGAYIHFGAVLGTLMVGNVFRVIIPGQRRLVAALERGETPDPSWAAEAKLRSTHNTYLTLPLLFTMISNHYPMTYGHPLNWLVLLAIVVITALARQYFVLRHRNVHRPAIVGASIAATALLAAMIMPRQSADVTPPAATDEDITARAADIIRQRCTTCHATSPVDPAFSAPPGGVALETVAQMRQWAPRIRARSVETHAMPLMNKTGMTEEERAIVGAWIQTGDTEDDRRPTDDREKID
jgi:uncharacterized membrane protein